MRGLRLFLIKSGRILWRRRGLWLRALVGWLIGISLLVIDQQSDYDMRLRMRGHQPTDPSLVILSIDHDDWGSWRKAMTSDTSSLNSGPFFLESSYWDPSAWQELLQKILAEQPMAVAVTTYFGQNIPRPLSEVQSQPPFADPRVIWSAQVSEEGRVLPSRFARSYSRNSGLLDFTLDRDGIIRRFGWASDQTPHLATQVARRLPGLSGENFKYLDEQSPIINYRGEPGTFTQISLGDFFAHRYPLHFFSDKIVLVSTPDPEGAELHTPVGKMAKAEVLANIIDNIHYHRWVQRLPFWMSVLLVLLIVLASATLTSRYPQFLAFFMLAWGNVFYITFSLWIFDMKYVWVPVMAPVAASFGTYVIFLSFQLTLKDYLTQQLEKEHQFLLDVEQLKNNFLSLISHDLRTPIAKIQAICDRLLTQNPQSEMAPDVVSLREVATELNRYISTLIQITRVESKDFRISRDALDVNELIEKATKNLDPLAKQKRIQLQPLLEPMFLIEADPVLIYEVILNLVENAIKYTQEDGSVRIYSQEVDGRVIVMVEDNGPGIPVEEQSRIFEKFYRGEHGKTAPRGSGLGLYLVKYFIELHGGQIFLESQIGNGTKVGFSLPIDHNLAEQGQAATEPSDSDSDSGRSTTEPIVESDLGSI